MRVAIPSWCGRISPVFDVARCLILVDVDGDTEGRREVVGVDVTGPAHRARLIGELGVDTLICGAISAPLEAALAAVGVDVIPHACGPVDAVLHAFLGEGLPDNAFLMPGCCERRRRVRHRQREQRSRSDVRRDVAQRESPIRHSHGDTKGE